MPQFHRILRAVDRLIVTAERHPAGARCVVRLAALACLGGFLAVLHVGLVAGLALLR